MNYSLIHNDVMVELHDETWEGYNGDFNPDDPHDQQLLRFDVSKLINGNWEPIYDGSYCTRLPNSLSVDNANKVVGIIMGEVEELVRGNMSIKKVCEKLSWICVGKEI